MQRHLLERERERERGETFCESFWCRYNKIRIDRKIVGCSNLVRIFNPTAVTEFKLLLLFIKCAAVYREPELKTERTFHYIHVILLFFLEVRITMDDNGTVQDFRSL